MGQHPIIALWVHPRSMSTAVERVMRERGDLTCFHEPFMYDYYLNRSPRMMPKFAPSDDQRVSYQETREMIFAAAEAGPVFFKDMSYYHLPQIYDDEEMAGRLVNLFLIRNPRRSILSYHKLDPEVSAVEIGLEALWLHYSWLVRAMKQAPVVVEAEKIQADPRGVIRALWQRIGLPDRPEAFDWQVETVPEDWKSVSGWHEDVSSASGIRPPEAAEDLEARFAAAAGEVPKLQRLLDQHLPFYELLKVEAG
ncbi:MAG: hypothetical protein AAGF86_18935 [Pseudomonadota bacterium]